MEFYTYDEKIKAIERITKFNSLITLQKINDYDIKSGLIDDIRKECIKIMDLYKFNIASSDINLIKQIRDFSNNLPNGECYKKDEIISKKNNQNSIDCNDNVQMIIYKKENFFKNILNKIKKFLNI